MAKTATAQRTVRWNPFARRRAEIQTAITASARRIDLKRPDDVKKWVKSPEEWQKLGWGFYDNVGQLKYGVNFLANCCSKVRIYVGERDPNDPEKAPEKAKDPRVMAALDQLQDGVGSHAELLRRAAVNLTVPGEFYIIGITERIEEKPVDPAKPWGEKEPVLTVPESWALYSTEEISKTPDGKLKLRTSGEEGAEAKELILDEDDDFILRVWYPHARFADKPDSPMRGILGDAEDVVDLRRMMRACDNSRTNAGILIFPTEETMGVPDPTQQTTGEGADERRDPVMKMVEDAMVAAVENPDGVERVAPLVLRVSRENKDTVDYISLGREITDTDLERYRMLQGSMEQGMNLPVGAVSGVKDVNHWGAWLIDEATFTGHVEPLILVLCSSLTSGYLRPWLTTSVEDGGPGLSEDEADRFVVWYDPTALVKDPDPNKTANEAFDKKAISWKAYRAALGISEDDAPTPEELAQRLAVERGGVDPAVVLALLQKLDPTIVPSEDAIPVDVLPPGQEPAEPEEPVEGPPPEEEPDNAVTAAATPKRARRDLGARLKNIDRDLRLRLYGAWGTAMGRALDRAGAKALSARSVSRQVKRDLGLEKKPHREVLAALGRERVKAFGLDEDALLEGSFDGLEDEFRDWTRRAQLRALDLVPRLAEHERAYAEGRMDENLDEAWTYAKGTLIALAKKRLYDPQPDAPAQGEVEAGALIPYGMVRAVVGIAGGSNTPTSVKVGIGSGPTVNGLLADQGIREKGFVWDYGDFPRTRPFEPHEDLDGVEFKNFDDEVLANHDSWPNVSYFMPGDHDGCFCDFEQVFEDTGATPIAASAGATGGSA